MLDHLKVAEETANQRTVDVFALGQVGVVLAVEKAVPIPPDNSLDVAVQNQ
jgi:hypothetical protein